MIKRVTIRRFKRFDEETFELPGHIVLAGPNNTGKTTVLQAIAAWGLALRRWKELNDFQRHGGAYTRAPIARQAFFAVPLRSFDLLWNQRNYRGSIEIEIESWIPQRWTVTMELEPNTTEQVFVRPKPGAEPNFLRHLDLNTVYVPSMTGLSTAEPVYQPPKIHYELGLGKPGEVLRNLLLEANQSEQAWARLSESIRRLFGYELLPPDPAGAHILAEYKEHAAGPAYDITCAGSGFQQVLMLLTFLHTRAASVLLLDEPDAHLHVMLQDAIYGELRSVAASQGSQLIIATHAEVVINSVHLDELAMLFDRPRRVTDPQQKRLLSQSLGVLSHIDVINAIGSLGVLYAEDYTDINILRAWAKVLDHPVRDALVNRIFWKSVVTRTREGGSGIRAKDHYAALRLVRDDLPGLVLLDGDAHPDIPQTEMTGERLQRLRWRRYEIESYLVHPDALARYVEHKVGSAAAQPHIEDLRRYFVDNFPPAVVRDPLGDHEFLHTTKARTRLIPPLLDAAGLPGVPYTQYHEIAAIMKLDEVHPEVVEKLDAIHKAFGL